MSREYKLPMGFSAAGLSAGLKRSGKKDLGIVISADCCKAAGVFTQNSVHAHCVDDNISILNENSTNIRAVLVNSGNANVANGADGHLAMMKIKLACAATFQLQSPNQLLTASTGMIGIPFQAQPVIDHLANLRSDLKPDYFDFAQAIWTTDTTLKVAEYSFPRGKIVGMAKGSGMIHPNLATVLVFLFTDAAISDDLDLRASLKRAADVSFNQISVDGDMSTNDMILLLANGSSGYAPSTSEWDAALSEVCTELACHVVADGEGASRLFEIEVCGAVSIEEARAIARGIASSSLVKAAVFGADPNWGRIVAAAGQYGTVNIQTVTLKFWDELLLDAGSVVRFDKESLGARMCDGHMLPIKLDLAIGSPENKAYAWGCDLTYDYVRINAEYST